MTTTEAKQILEKWSLCRCVYSRQPTCECRCSTRQQQMARHETPEQTRRWEANLSKKLKVNVA